MEVLLFKRHPFSGPLVFALITGLPWLVFYFPGTLHWDAFAQLQMYMGVVEKTNHHPVITTELMGGFISFGRHLFQSDTIGFFLYTITQFMIQSLTFSYASYCIQKLKPPVLFRWGALLYWTVFPFFPIWGYTMAKDTLYYVFVLLLVAVLADTLTGQDWKGRFRQTLLLFISVGGITLFRNDGRYVVCITLLFSMILCRKFWKRYLSGIAVCMLIVFLVEGVYMSYHHIPKGSVGEMLSIPLQQTARYLREHQDELTLEEAAVLQQGFTVDIDTLADLYNPILSDPVKNTFQKHLDAEYLGSYFKVWFRQFMKHPDTYVQAFLNHVYGYFYPDMHDFSHTTAQYTAVFNIAGMDGICYDYFDVKFGFGDSMRKILQKYFNLIEKIPLFCMLFSPGIHAYILFGELVYLLAKKVHRNILLLIPGYCVLMVCLVSPVNASIRYMMPIMAMLPVTVVWCNSSTGKESA